MDWISFGSLSYIEHHLILHLTTKFHLSSANCTKDTGGWVNWVKWVFPLENCQFPWNYPFEPKPYLILNVCCNFQASVYIYNGINEVWAQWAKWVNYSAQDESWAWLPVSKWSVYHSLPLCQISCFLQKVHTFA